MLMLSTLPVLMGASGTAVRKNDEGNRLFEQRKFDAAQQAYEEALKRDGGEAVLHYNRAAALAAQGRVSEAMEAYRLALGQADDALAADIFHNQGNMMMNLAKQAEQTPPEDPEAPKAEDLLKGAIQNYREALRRRSDDNDSKYNLETALRRLQALPPPPPPQPNPDSQNQEESEDQQDQQQQPQDPQQNPSEDQQPEPSDNQEQQNAKPEDQQEQKGESKPSEEQQKPQPAQARPDEKTDAKPSEDKPQEGAPQEPKPMDQQEAERILDRLLDEEKQHPPPRQGAEADENPDGKDW